MDALARANAKNPAVKRLLQARCGCLAAGTALRARLCSASACHGRASDCGRRRRRGAGIQGAERGAEPRLCVRAAGGAWRGAGRARVAVARMLTGTPRRPRCARAAPPRRRRTTSSSGTSCCAARATRSSRRVRRGGGATPRTGGALSSRRALLTRRRVARAASSTAASCCRPSSPSNRPPSPFYRYARRCERAARFCRSAALTRCRLRGVQPNGRFEVNTKICLSISTHHPEHWQPSWSLRTALTALVAFFPTKGDGAIGALDYPPQARRAGGLSAHVCAWGADA